MNLIDELTYRSYARNRTLNPNIKPKEWTLGFSNVPAMEERYQRDIKEGLYRPLGSVKCETPLTISATSR